MAIGKLETMIQRQGSPKLPANETPSAPQTNQQAVAMAFKQAGSQESVANFSTFPSPFNGIKLRQSLALLDPAGSYSPDRLERLTTIAANGGGRQTIESLFGQSTAKISYLFASPEVADDKDRSGLTTPEADAMYSAILGLNTSQRKAFEQSLDQAAKPNPKPLVRTTLSAKPETFALSKGQNQIKEPSHEIGLTAHQPGNRPSATLTASRLPVGGILEGLNQTKALNPSVAAINKPSLTRYGGLDPRLQQAVTLLTDAYATNPRMSWKDAEALGQKHFSYDSDSSNAEANRQVLGFVRTAQMLSNGKNNTFNPTVLNNLMRLSANGSLLEKLVPPRDAKAGPIPSVRFSSAQVQGSSMDFNQVSQLKSDLLNLSPAQWQGLYKRLEKPDLFPASSATISMNY